MKIKKSELWLYVVFSIIFFWDLIERYFPNLQFVFLLLILMLNINHIKKFFTKEFFFIAFIVLLQGAINIAIGNNTFSDFIIQYFSIIVCYLSFSCVIYKCDSKRVICIYWKTAFIMAILGAAEIILSLANVSFETKLLSLFVNTSFTQRVIGPFPRIASLCNEPSFLGYFLAPAIFLIIYSFYKKDYSYIEFNQKKQILEACLIFIVYIMTFSTVSYIGIIISFVLIFMNDKISLRKIVLPLIAVLCVLFLYTNVPDFKMRVDDTYNMFFNENTHTGTVNLSTFTYYANSKVVKESITSTYGLGTGLGSYKYQFDKYNIGAWGDSGLNLNREDGNSMLFRITTELGIIGILSVFIFLYILFCKSNGKNRIYAMAFLTLFLMIIIRMGNYTHGGIWLYICLYIKLCEENMNSDNIISEK